MKKTHVLLIFLFLLTIGGLLDASYLSYEHFFQIIPPCTTSIFSNCGRVLSSSYATIGGIPVAYLGALNYLLLCVSTLGIIFTTRRFFRIFLSLYPWMGAAMSLYFIFIMGVVLHSLCIYCLLSAGISLLIFCISQSLFFPERLVFFHWIFRKKYRVVKKILFLIDPEIVHRSFSWFGKFLGATALGRAVVSYFLYRRDPTLTQTISGITFRGPVGLAAGFDPEANLPQILPSLSFGFGTIGTVTNAPCTGNPSPQYGRLPRSQSLMVNKGFKNPGIAVIMERLQHLSSYIPIGLSIGPTNNQKIQTIPQAIADILASLRYAQKAPKGPSYYEINISCPNTQHPFSFSIERNLDQLLEAIDELSLPQPIFIKMPINETNVHFVKMLDVIMTHRVAGIIVGNLQKNRKDPSLVSSELKQFPVGNFSGKPTFARSNELIALAYRHAGKKLTIIGCGGVFSAEDAYIKMKLGASLIELITGMIFVGPQLVSEITNTLSELLKKDGFDSLTQAIGSEAAHYHKENYAMQSK